MNRRLTLNLGVRYDDLQFLPDPIRTDTNNVSPRVGFAFSPDERTVVHGSFGFYYDRIPTRATSNAHQRDGINYFVAILLPTAADAPVFPNILRRLRLRSGSNRALRGSIRISRTAKARRRVCRSNANCRGRFRRRSDICIFADGTLFCRET